jgi:UDP-N-acetylmuramate--alanine ligase
MGSNARVGKSQYLVAEADESDRSFLKLSPIVSVVTNIDREHMDTYRDMEDVENTFVDFMDRVPFYGMVVLCADDERLRRLWPRLSRRITTYGRSPDADFHIVSSDCGEAPVRCRFRVTYRSTDLGEFRLHVPGAHNMLNATAAIAVGLGLDVNVDKIRGALEQFRGVDRRFQIKGAAGGVTVVDDYAHHPTEIAATLAAARAAFDGRRLVAAFQPHLYSRTRDFAKEFGQSLAAADAVYLTEIYPAREQPIEGVTATLVADAIAAAGGSLTWRGERGALADALADGVRPGDVVLTIGAGDVTKTGPELLQRLQGET